MVSNPNRKSTINQSIQLWKLALMRIKMTKWISQLFFGIFRRAMLNSCIDESSCNMQLAVKLNPCYSWRQIMLVCFLWIFPDRRIWKIPEELLFLYFRYIEIASDIRNYIFFFVLQVKWSHKNLRNGVHKGHSSVFSGVQVVFIVMKRCFVSIDWFCVDLSNHCITRKIKLS